MQGTSLEALRDTYRRLLAELEQDIAKLPEGDMQRLNMEFSAGIYRTRLETIQAWMAGTEKKFLTQ